MRAALIPLVLAAASGLATAQTPPAGAALEREDSGPGRNNQRVERIVVEDAGSKVEELRVGGQTQSISVQPKAAVPAYEVRPVDGTRAGAVPENGRDGASNTGSRVWNLRQF